MTLITKEDPKGIDWVLDKIQRSLYNNLTNIYGWTNYNSYPRVYLNPINKDSSLLLPEVYTGSKEYKEMYFDDRYYAESYVVTPPMQTAIDPTGMFESDVWLIFQVNLGKMYPTIAGRADENAHRDVMLSLDRIGHEFDFKSGIITTVDQVYQGLYVDKVRLTDMQNCHVFRINLKINYDYRC
jgi:hypothetical protein